MNANDDEVLATHANPMQEIARLLHAAASLIASVEHADVGPLVRNVRVATRLLVMVAARTPVPEVDGDGARSMPAYGRQIPVPDRWAIVAYVRVLEASRSAPLSQVPIDIAEQRGWSASNKEDKKAGTP